MIYNLGNYRYKKGKIYKKVFWFIFKCIDKGPYPYMTGVKKVNNLCNITEITRDYSMLEHIVPYEGLSGNFLVNFKKDDGHFGNDPMPATITPEKGRLYVHWDNGRSACCDCTIINVFRLKE